MENKSVNTTIESSEIETKGQKAARSLANKLTTIAIVICTLFYAICMITLLVTIHEEREMYKPSKPETILSLMDSFRPGRIVFDVAETKGYGQKAERDYIFPYSIAEYEEASLKAYAYDYAGDTASKARYEKIKSEARDKMEYTIYADKIDKRYQYLKEHAADVQTEEIIDLEDGIYSIDLSFEGGSGKASVESPAQIEIENGKCMARIRWSSPNYDYMIVDGEKYQPVNADGNSEFLIPVAAFDKPLTVVGDTVAMSVPHEIEYSLTFHSDSIVMK